MKKIVVATIKTWNIVNAEKFKAEHPEYEVQIITHKSELTLKLLEEIHPEYIFIPHWSWIIPKKIFKNYRCVVFHMTDLPFGRGGSPLQNLIARGIYNTKISAIQVADGVDTGPIYTQIPMNISEGNADQIFKRVSEIIFKVMIPQIMNDDLIPIEQTGTPVIFKRRTPEESEIPSGLSQRQIYDYIRMLDGEGYPNAFMRIEGGRVYFHNARLKDEVVYTDARFTKEDDHE